MKKTLIVLGAAALVALASSCNQNQAAAPQAAAAKDSVAVAGSIVYFNMDKVMDGYDMANDLNSVFETMDPGKKTLLFFGLIRDYKGLLTTSVAQAQYQKLQQQQQEYQQYAMRKQQEMAEEQQVMMNQIANAIAEYVVEYNATHQYALILTTAGGVLSTPVVTGDPSLDITEDLLAGLNAAYIKTKESAKK